MKNLRFIANLLIFSFLLLESTLSITQKYTASDGREYLIEPDLKYNWYQAFHECARRDYQLVVIDSAAKNQAIIDLLKKVIGKPKNMWLGGNDEFSSSTNYDRPFYWSVTGQKFTFTYWSEKNPDNYQGQEHCVHIWANKPNFQWNDVACTYLHGFICEVNEYYEKYQNDIKNTVKQTITSMKQEFSKIQQQQLLEINLNLKNINTLMDNFDKGMQKSQNSSNRAAQKVLDEQQIQIEKLSEKMFEQVGILSVQLENSTSDLSSQFAEKLNGSFTAVPGNIKNFIVFNQRG